MKNIITDTLSYQTYNTIVKLDRNNLFIFISPYIENKYLN